jgi:hypothetical protein
VKASFLPGGVESDFVDKESGRLGCNTGFVFD